MAKQKTFDIQLPKLDNWTLAKFERGGGIAVVACNDDMRRFKASRIR